MRFDNGDNVSKLSNAISLIIRLDVDVADGKSMSCDISTTPLIATVFGMKALVHIFFAQDFSKF